MTLRSQLAWSHLKVLLAFVVIHLALFILAIQFSGRHRSFERTHFQELRLRANQAKDYSQLQLLMRAFAQEKDLVVALENESGERQVFGDGDPRRGRHRRFRQVLWSGEQNSVASISIQGPGGPPTNPITHVLLTTLLAGVFGVFLAFRSSKTISKPLAKLMEATKQLEAGSEDRIPLNQLEGPQEIQNLASSFAHMSETLSSNLAKLKEERDRAEASEASRRQLIADVSHNLRTPLAAAAGWLDSLIDGHIEEPEPCLRQVRRETLWAAQRLERLLHLSRWEHSEPMMTLSSLGLSDIVLEVAENLEDRAREVNLSLELDMEPGLKVQGDRHYLRDLIQILLENTIEHCGEGGQAKVVAKVEDGAVRVIVQDDGPGFEADFVADWSGQPLVAKTGRVSLGLAIASRLAQAHGSELRLSNREEQSGAKASFCLTPSPQA